MRRYHIILLFIVSLLFLTGCKQESYYSEESHVVKYNEVITNLTGVNDIVSIKVKRFGKENNMIEVVILHKQGAR